MEVFYVFSFQANYLCQTQNAYRHQVEDLGRHIEHVERVQIPHLLRSMLSLDLSFPSHYNTLLM